MRHEHARQHVLHAARRRARRARRARSSPRSRPRRGVAQRLPRPVPGVPPEDPGATQQEVRRPPPSDAPTAVASDGREAERSTQRIIAAKSTRGRDERRPSWCRPSVRQVRAPRARASRSPAKVGSVVVLGAEVGDDSSPIIQRSVFFSFISWMKRSCSG